MDGHVGCYGEEYGVGDCIGWVDGERVCFIVVIAIAIAGFGFGSDGCGSECVFTSIDRCNQRSDGEYP